MFLVKFKHSITLYLFLYVTLILRLTQSNLKRILVGKLRDIKIRYFLRNYHVKHIPQMHILNFNHKYLITPHSHVATIMLPCCHRAALLLPSQPVCCRCCHHAATLLPPHCRHRYAVAAAALPPPPLCYHQAAATATATTPPPPLPLLSSCRCRHHAAAVAIIYIAR